MNIDSVQKQDRASIGWKTAVSLEAERTIR